MKGLNKIIIFTSLLFIIVGCSNMNDSADEIITNMIESNDEIYEYYAEGKLIVYEGDDVKEESSFKEYVNEDGQRKIEMNDLINNNYIVTVRTENEIITYDQNSNTAFKIDFQSHEEPQSLTQREQITSLIQITKDTHDQKVVGEEKMNGFDTFHLVLTAKEKNTLLGNLEFWVDKKTWFIVKSKNIFGDTHTETMYTKIDLEPSFPEETFTIDLPNDVKVESIDDYVTAEEGDYKDAEKLLGQSFYVFNDNGLELNNIEITESKLHDEVALIYTKDSLPGVTLSIFPTPEGKGMEIDGGDFTIRGLPAEYDKVGEFHFFLWDEKGLRYSLIVENPEISKEQIMELTEKMILSSE